MANVTVWSCDENFELLNHEKWLENGSVNEIAAKLEPGVYTTLRTFQREKFLYLEHHFDRLEESAAIIGTPISIKRLEFKKILRVAINENQFTEIRIRIHISIFQNKTTKTFLILEPLTTPSDEEIFNGVSIVTKNTQRKNPLAKATQFLAEASEIRENIDHSINEVLMIGENGLCLEGLSSNFYGVYHGTIWTADEGILHGITRTIILEILRNEKISVNLNGYPFEKNFQLDEAFISSTSRGVLPVTKIDGRKIGNGMPGPLTKSIRGSYERKINELIEEI
jgi:branched-chain amino acid aminotransferase